MSTATIALESTAIFSEIRLPRQTGTHADVLAAVGLAELLYDATHDRGVRIVDEGTAFRVVLSRPRPWSASFTIPHTPGYRYLLVATKKQPNPPIPRDVRASDALHYQHTKERVDALRAQEQALFEAARKAGQKVNQEALQAVREQWPLPRDIWRRLVALLVLQGHETANSIYATIVQMSPEQFRAAVQSALQALAEGRPSGLKWPVSTVQLFAPLAAKGYARLKPDSTARGDKTKDAWADPFMEWLRYRGYFSAAVPVFYGSKGEHIRLLCPVPGDITFTAYERVVAELPPPPAGAGPPKIDILATLALARLLVERSPEFAAAGVEPIEGLVMMGRTPAEVISGVAVSNFQSLGQARAVSALTELALPGWFALGTQQDADDWLRILDEHRAIIRGLRDDRSDEFALLQGYRRFLERRGERALDALLDFAGAYGQFVLRAREAKRQVRQFGREDFRRIVVAMNKRYAAILDDEGFKAVAAAVRRATVGAQSLKAQGKDHREIRYGLLPELRRTRELPGDEPFLTAVADFVSLYNSENARRFELTRQRGAPRVSTEEFAAFARLVDTYHADVVGALLCAYGTCTERREQLPGGPEPDTDLEPGGVESTEGEESETE